VPPTERSHNSAKNEGHRRQLSGSHRQMLCPPTNGIDYKPCYLTQGDSAKKTVDFVLALKLSVIEYWQLQVLSGDQIMELFGV